MTQQPANAAKPHPMQQFHDYLQKIQDVGILRPNRTGTNTIFIPGHMLKFDMADGFPAITTKKLAFKSMVGEIVGFWRGYDSAADFRSVGTKVWDGNANVTPAWLANPNRKGHDDLGRIYSKQWTDWRDWRTAQSEVEAQALEAKGYELLAHDPTRNTWVYRRGINQVELALETILKDPTNRRIMLTGWRPDEFDQMALPPCHVDYQWMVDTESNTLHMTNHQRSFDTFLAFNISMSALFLCVMAKLAGLKAGTFTHFIGDGHIYENHFEQTKLLLSREHFEQPKLVLGDSIPSGVKLDEVRGVFERIQPEDIYLENYQHHPAIPAPFAA